MTPSTHQHANGFGLDHLPYGVFSVDGGPRRVGVRRGDEVLDLAAATGRPELAAPSLNPLMERGPSTWRQLREQVLDLAPDLPGIPLSDVVMHLPFEVADYVDFYGSDGGNGTILMFANKWNQTNTGGTQETKTLLVL